MLEHDSSSFELASDSPAPTSLLVLSFDSNGVLIEWKNVFQLSLFPLQDVHCGYNVGS